MCVLRIAPVLCGTPARPAAENVVIAERPAGLGVAPDKGDMADLRVARRHHLARHHLPERDQNGLLHFQRHVGPGSRGCRFDRIDDRAFAGFNVDDAEDALVRRDMLVERNHETVLNGGQRGRQRAVDIARHLISATGQVDRDIPALFDNFYADRDRIVCNAVIIDNIFAGKFPVGQLVETELQPIFCLRDQHIRGALNRF